MTKKEKFIAFIKKEVFDRPDIYEDCNNADDWEDICSYWKTLKETSVSDSNNQQLTELGRKIFQYMQSIDKEMTAKEIGEGLFISSRSVSGAMRKLITCGFAEKTNANPTMYKLTETGKTFN